MKRLLYLAVMTFLLFTGSFHFADSATDFSQSINSQETNKINTSVSSAAFNLGNLPSASNGLAPNQLVIRAYDDAAINANFYLSCSTSPFSPVGGCSGAWAGAAAIYFTNPTIGTNLPNSPTILTFSSTTMPLYDTEPGRYYFLHVNKTGPTNGIITLLGNNTASSTCVAGCIVQNTGQPYFIITSGTSTINWDAATIATPIDWSALVFVSTTTGLFSGTTSQAALDSIADRCEDPNNNLFSRGLCYAGVYLFIPDPGILNNYAQLPTLMQTKFPFSWVAQVKEAISARTAGASGQMTAFSFNLANLGIGSSTPIGNVLPNYVGFSSTTVTQYIGLSAWNAGQALIAAALWLALGLDIYYTVRRRHAHV